MSSTLFWEAFNADRSFLPLYLPLFIWVLAFAHCQRTGKDFHRWHALHNFHNFGAILLGCISLYYNDDDVFSERIPILWSIGYFVVDLVECCLRLDVTYALHALFCLLLGFANYYTPTFFELRMNSKATFLEISNPFMHLSKKTRKAAHFLMFAIIFTLCRIVWMPIMMRQLLAASVPLTDPRLLVFVGFYGLNLFWYFKIIRILVEGSSGATAKKES